MKYILPIILFLPLGLIAQNDSVDVQLIDICPNLFKDSIVDSTYKNFYVDNNVDTIYFNNIYCVQLYQLTDPYVTTFWKVKKGFANNQIEYHYQKGDEWSIIKGLFSNGSLISGYEEVYYANGKLKCHGTYKNGRQYGDWVWYTKEGELRYKVKFIDGIGIIE